MPAGSFHMLKLAYMTRASWLLRQAQNSSYHTCQLAPATCSNWLIWPVLAGSCHKLKLVHIKRASWLLPHSPTSSFDKCRLAPVTSSNYCSSYHTCQLTSLKLAPKRQLAATHAPAGSYGTCQLAPTKHSRWHMPKLAPTMLLSWLPPHAQAGTYRTHKLPYNTHSSCSFHNLKLACTTLSSWLLPLGQAVSYSTTFSSWLLQHAQDGYCHTQKLALSSWLIPHIKAGSSLVYIFHTYYLLHICTVQVFNTFYFFDWKHFFSFK